MTNQEAYLDVKRRHDFVLLFDVTDGNPNGDPDAGNMPRVDPETMQGIVTDVCLKRKVRNYIDMARGTESRNKIFIQEGAVLNRAISRAYSEQQLPNDKKPETVKQARAWMCNNFYDIRMFGAVLTTGENAGQVRGPVQLTFSRSINRVLPMDLSITRMAVTDEKDASKERTMGRKALIPYGLYRAHGFFNPHLALQTGVSPEDLSLFWQALQQMWDFDRSAARGLMACQGIFIFSHESDLGNAPAYTLFKRVVVEKLEEVDSPRSVSDYSININKSELPEGVTLHQL